MNGNGTKRDVQKRVNAIRSELEALQRDMRGMVADATDAATKNMNDAVGGAMETAHETADRVNEWSNENLEGVRDAFRHQPLTSLALAVTAGAMLGAIFGRR
jgi:ElaB/YqjD/DUF883 family membrane-anchored ribosome-binding protein